MQGSARTAIIVGAGIVGMATALRLQADGLSVTVFDARDPGTGCSEGNSGGFGIGLVAPIAMPGILRQVPRLLLDPEEPLFISPRIFPRALPWFWQFARNARPHRVRQIAAARAALNHQVLDTLMPLVKLAGAEDLVRHEGMVFLFRGDVVPTGAAARFRLSEDHGIATERLDAAEIAGLYPGIATDVRTGVRIPGNWHCTDPLGLVTAFARAFEARGGRIVRADVTALTASGTGVVAGGATYTACHVVVAAGVWSRKIIAALGYSVPLEAERGYHLMLPKSGVAFAVPTTLADRNIVLTPMDNGLRITGIAEFAPIDAPPDYSHCDRLLAQAKCYFPKLDGGGAERWMGPRPSTPDSLPVIGQAPRHPGLWFAFGHGQSGLAHASVTAASLGAAIAGRRAGINLTPYGIERFQRSYNRHLSLSPPS
jgi:D-amino-acid dehydrogenase